MPVCAVNPAVTSRIGAVAASVIVATADDGVPLVVGAGTGRGAGVLVLGSQAASAEGSATTPAMPTAALSTWRRLVIDRGPSSHRTRRRSCCPPPHPGTEPGRRVTRVASDMLWSATPRNHWASQPGSECRVGHVVVGDSAEPGWSVLHRPRGVAHVVVRYALVRDDGRRADARVGLQVERAHGDGAGDHPDRRTRRSPGRSISDLRVDWYDTGTWRSVVIADAPIRF